jgi:hypothetical protein
MKKDESLIPVGHYCYTYDHNGKYIVCPYYDVIQGAPEQADGYCHFLEKGDIEIGEDAKASSSVMITQNGVELNKDEVPDFIFTGLLWDQVKECGINDEIDEDTSI